MTTRRMSRENKKKMTKMLIHCLVFEGTTPRFKWFDTEPEKWEAMHPILESVLPQVNIFQDCNTLGHLLKAWTDLINEADDEKKKELNVAALTALQDLLFADEGRKAWFEKVKTPAEIDWNPHEDAQVQDWNTKLLRIASVVNSSVDTVIERFDQAKSIVQRYNNFLTLKIGTVRLT